MLEKSEFGKYLFSLRKHAGLSQEELAEKIGVHMNTISQWENGLFIPKTPKLKKLAEALNVTETDLLNGPAKQEFEVKIMMGVKSMTGLAGVTLADNSFIYGVDDNLPQIVMMGKISIATPEDREKAIAEIIRKFNAACWMFDHKADAEA